MAKPIKMTPVLSGRDAVKFLNTIKENSNKKATRDFLSEIRNSAKKMQSILINR